MQEPLIFDASALFNFGHRGNLEHILERLRPDFSLLIPPIVEEEVSLKDPAFYASLIARFFAVRDASPDNRWSRQLASFAQEVGGGGEYSVVALAFETSGTVVMDEKAGRVRAKEYGLAVTGTIGLLNHAVCSSWWNEEDALNCVKLLRQRGFRVKPVGATATWKEYFQLLNDTN